MIKYELIFFLVRMHHLIDCMFLNETMIDLSQICRDVLGVILFNHDSFDFGLQIRINFGL